MRYITLILTALLVMTTSATAAADSAAAPQDGRSAQEILDALRDTESLGFQAGELTMTLIVADRAGQSRERQLQVQGERRDGRFNALIRVLRPAEVAGQAYLFRENESGPNDIYAFLPAIDDAPRRIAGSQRNASFMGTNFSYSDLQRTDLEGATAQRLPNETIGNFPVYVIEITPAESASTDYSRAMAWIRTADDIPLRIRYFDRNDEEDRTLFTERVDEHNGRSYIQRMTLRAVDGSSTTMVIDSINEDVSFESSTFTPAALSN